MRRLLHLMTLAAIGLALLTPQLVQAERLKDLTTIAGVRQNQLSGYGIVVGLDGSGDQTTQTPFTVQSIAAMLQQMGVTLPPGTNLQLKNVAAVMVTTSLPAFAQPGQLLDVTVSSLPSVLPFFLPPFLPPFLPCDRYCRDYRDYWYYRYHRNYRYYGFSQLQWLN